MSLIDQSLRDHLIRLLVAGGVSIVGGLLLAKLSTERRPFGLMNAAWGLVDAIIAMAGLRNPSFGKNADEVEGGLHFLLLNMGFNCGYVAVGITMMALAGPRQNIRQFGAAVIVQGAILLALDGYLLNTVPFWLAKNG